MKAKPSKQVRWQRKLARLGLCRQCGKRKRVQGGKLCRTCRKKKRRADMIYARNKRASKLTGRKLKGMGRPRIYK